MRSFFQVSVFIVFLLSACNLPKPGQSGSDEIAEPGIESPAQIETQQVYAYSECGFVWAREPLPDLSDDFNQVLKRILPKATGRMEAYGENCINNEGQVVRFLAMETDFYVTLNVSNLEDQTVLGELVEQVMGVIAEFPIGETPGPQPGYVGITFEGPGGELRLWFTQADVQAAIDGGLRGEELFDYVQTK